MTYVERCVAFSCQGDQLLGILCAPSDALPGAGMAVLIVVGGPQYRVGAHRQFVQLSRSLAASGLTAMRFDMRGMGDSTGSSRGFDQLSDDIGAAVDVLAREAPLARTIALIGLCDGASASLIYMHHKADPRVSGLCLLNPWLRSEAGLARTRVRHYYWRRLSTADFWRKAAAGRVGLRALQGLAGNVLRGFAPGGTQAASSQASHSEIDFSTAMLKGLQHFGGKVLIVLSGADLTANEFSDAVRSDRAWRTATQAGNVQRIDLEGADHTLSDRQFHRRFEQAVIAWVRGPLETSAA